MHLIEARDHSLIVRDRPSFFKSFFVLIWSSLFVAIPGMLLFTTISEVGTTRLLCQRLEPEQLSCEIAESKFLGLVRSSNRKYTQVLQAQLNHEEEIASDGDEIQDNWVSLETSKGMIPLFEDRIRYGGVRGSETEMLALTDEINTLIQLNESSFIVERNLMTSPTQLFFPVLFFSIFIAIGLGVIGLTFQIRTAQFNRDRDRLDWKRYSLLGIQKITVPFDEITKICIDIEQDDDGLNNYRIFLESEDRDRIQLGVTHWQKQAHCIQSKLQTFLKLE